MRAEDKARSDYSFVPWSSGVASAIPWTGSKSRETVRIVIHHSGPSARPNGVNDMPQRLETSAQKVRHARRTNTGIIQLTVSQGQTA